MDSRLPGICLEALGPCTVVADRSWPHGEALVLEVRDGDGLGWIVKRFARPHHFQRELAAYREWVPALGDRAPELRARDEETLCLVISALPGEVGRDGNPEIYRQAGSLTRLFHESAPALPDPEFASRTAAYLEEWLERGRDLIEEPLVDFARDQVKKISDLPPPVTVPCHWDNHPRNWLVDDSGVVRFIDFQHARRQAWMLDFERLYFGQWQVRADLREAFLEGYGKILTDADVATMELWGAQSAVSTIVWAREHDDADFEAQGRRTLRTLRDGAGDSAV